MVYKYKSMVWRSGLRPRQEVMGILGLAVGLAAGLSLWMAGCVWAAVPEEGTGAGNQTLHITRKLEEDQLTSYSQPSETYWDKDGKEYRLDHWDVVTVPGHMVQRRMEKQIVYAGVEGAEGIPESIPVEEEVSGMPAKGELSIRQSRMVKEEWQEGFSAPVTFHSYGADEYQAGNLTVQGDDILGSSVALGGELLKVMGLSPMEYRILSMEWTGEPYVDEKGQLCRQAMAAGQKLLRDYEVTYEGEVSFMEPDAYEMEMTYRPVAASQVTVMPETRGAEAVPEPEEAAMGGLWYWVRSGFVITVGAGLIGITVGLLTLLVLWYRQRRREHGRRYLPQIKG